MEKSIFVSDITDIDDLETMKFLPTKIKLDPTTPITDILVIDVLKGFEFNQPDQSPDPVKLRWLIKIKVNP